MTLQVLETVSVLLFGSHLDLEKLHKRHEGTANILPPRNVVKEFSLRKYLHEQWSKRNSKIFPACYKDYKHYCLYLSTLVVQWQLGSITLSNIIIVKCQKLAIVAVI